MNYIIFFSGKRYIFYCPNTKENINTLKWKTSSFIKPWIDKNFKLNFNFYTQNLRLILQQYEN